MTRIPTCALGDVALEITFADGQAAGFAYIWLRDNCPSAFHPETQERTLDLLTLPEVPRPRDVVLSADDLTIIWEGDGHQSRFALDWLAAHRPGDGHAEAAFAPVAWPAGMTAAEIPRHDAGAILGDDAALAAWLSDTLRLGLSIVEGVADRDGAGAEVAARVAFLRQTNFGVTFEVMNKPDPNNIAYTAEALTLHTDLPNQELPPGFQFLHCRANEATGGGSVFADGVALAEILRRDDPAAFDLLTQIAIPFRFHDADTDLRAWRPAIRLDRSGAVEEVSWSVHLADSFDMPADQMPGYYRAYRAFMALTRDPAHQVVLKLKAGEMAVFDNRRVLHGREAFDPATGFRHLQGCYVDRGDLISRLRALTRG